MVYNKRWRSIPDDAIYVGRPTKWGNPYSHLSGTIALYKVDSREEAILKYREWITNNDELIADAKRELRNRDLVCWCAPSECHADILIEIANSE